MNKDQVISELFFGFRFAKRLLQIDHPTCGCGEPSVGCHVVQVDLHKRVVEGRCEEHWKPLVHLGADHWRVRWDQLEDAREVTVEDQPQSPMDEAFNALTDIAKRSKSDE